MYNVQINYMAGDGDTAHLVRRELRQLPCPPRRGDDAGAQYTPEGPAGLHFSKVSAVPEELMFAVPFDFATIVYLHPRWVRFESFGNEAGGNW